MPARLEAGIGSRPRGDARKLQVDHWLFRWPSSDAVWGPSGTRAEDEGPWGTLFGPEGASPPVERGVRAGSSARADLENSIASASIWAKLQRAYGGCLGARSR
jgi:hypothetical protein